MRKHDLKISDKEFLKLANELPEEYAIAIRLYYFEKMTQAKMCTELKLPLCRVQQRIAKGRRLIRKQICNDSENTVNVVSLRNYIFSFRVLVNPNVSSSEN